MFQGKQGGGMQMSFYFVRHGKTQFNQQHKVQGWCDSPLIEEGVRAARQAGSKLAPVEFVRAYASDKGRTCQTLAELLDARAIARGTANGEITPSNAEAPSPSTAGAAAWLSHLEQAMCATTPTVLAGLPLRTDWRLREWCYGDLETQTGEMLHRRLIEGFGEELSFAEENERLPETANNLARLDASGRAETFDQITERLWSFLREVGGEVLEEGGGNVVAATHAFTIRSIMYLLDRSRINDPLVITNGSITRVDFDGRRFELRETGVMEPRLG